MTSRKPFRKQLSWLAIVMMVVALLPVQPATVLAYSGSWQEVPGTSTWGSTSFSVGGNTSQCIAPFGWSLSCSKEWDVQVQWTDYAQPYPTEWWHVVSTTDDPGGQTVTNPDGSQCVTMPSGTSTFTTTGSTKSWGGGCQPVNRKPTVSLSCPASGYAGDTVTCTASASDLDGDTISWSWGGTGPTNSNTYTLSGSWVQASVAVTDGKNAWAEAWANIQVLTRNNKPSVSINCDPSTTQVNVAVNCSASGSDPDAGQTVTVSLDGATSSGAGIASVQKQETWAIAGTYTVSATASDSGNPSLSDTKSTSVTVTAPNGLSVSVSCNPSSVTADGTTSSLCSTSVSGGTPPYLYSWGSSTKTYGPWSNVTSTQTVPVSVTVTDSSSPAQQGAGSAVITVGPSGAPPPPPGPT